MTRGLGASWIVDHVACFCETLVRTTFGRLEQYQCTRMKMDTTTYQEVDNIGQEEKAQEKGQDPFTLEGMSALRSSIFIDTLLTTPAIDTTT